jgi:ribosomal protein S18 acetylase RimI-like enzyme
MDNSIQFAAACQDDANEILVLQRSAYQDQPDTSRTVMIPPLCETIDDVRRAISDRFVIKATQNGQIVASARGKLIDGTCHIERVIVHPTLQKRGLGKRIMQALEAQFEDAGRFELFTEMTNRRNIHFYSQLGYRPFMTRPRPGTPALVYLEKYQPLPTTGPTATAPVDLTMAAAGRIA